MTPASTRIVVDLPAPLRPSSAVAMPGATCRSMPRTASTDPNLTHSPDTSTTADRSGEVMASIVPLTVHEWGKTPRFASGGEALTLLGEVDEVGGRLEAVAVRGGELAGAGNEAGEARRSVGVPS